MSVVVMGTANRYLLDVLGGVACAYLGHWLAAATAHGLSSLRDRLQRESHRSRSSQGPVLYPIPCVVRSPAQDGINDLHRPGRGSLN
jgi:hypothetical protein